ANKIIQTPVGIYELKQLFSTKISSTHHSENSQAEVKNRIKELIAKEDKCKPLSDQKIANCLKEQQIKISRRTVAKYGEEMLIVTTSKRKEEKVYEIKSRIFYDKKIRFLIYSFPLFNRRCNSLMTRLGLLILPSTGVWKRRCKAAMTSE